MRPGVGRFRIGRFRIDLENTHSICSNQGRGKRFSHGCRMNRRYGVSRLDWITGAPHRFAQATMNRKREGLG